MVATRVKKILKRSHLEMLMESQMQGAMVKPWVVEYEFCPGRNWRFDFAWPALKVALEVEGGTRSGGRHVTGSGYEKDCEKYNAAVVMGWAVIRATEMCIKSGAALVLVESVLRSRRAAEQLEGEK